MKRTIVLIIAATLWLMAGCSSSPSSNRYIETAGPTIEPIQTASEQPTSTENLQSGTQVDPVKVEATQQGEKNEQQTPVKKSAPANKSTKSERLQAAKKSNESLSKAVTDSIMDNGADQATKNKPEAVLLKKSIEQIRTLIKELKQHVDNNDPAKMTNVSLQIVQNWEEMKAGVKASYPDMVDFLQKKIVLLNELQTAEEIDAKLLLQLDYELYQAFRQLADKAGL